MLQRSRLLARHALVWHCRARARHPYQRHQIELRISLTSFFAVALSILPQGELLQIRSLRMANSWVRSQAQRRSQQRKWPLGLHLAASVGPSVSFGSREDYFSAVVSALQAQLQKGQQGFLLHEHWSRRPLRVVLGPRYPSCISWKGTVDAFTSATVLSRRPRGISTCAPRSATGLASAANVGSYEVK